MFEVLLICAAAFSMLVLALLFSLSMPGAVRRETATKAQMARLRMQKGCEIAFVLCSFIALLRFLQSI